MELDVVYALSALENKKAPGEDNIYGEGVRTAEH